jgi:hypothetical protein
MWLFLRQQLLDPQSPDSASAKPHPHTHYCPDFRPNVSHSLTPSPSVATLLCPWRPIPAGHPVILAVRLAKAVPNYAIFDIVQTHITLCCNSPNLALPCQHRSPRDPCSVPGKGSSASGLWPQCACPDSTLQCPAVPLPLNPCRSPRHPCSAPGKGCFERCNLRSHCAGLGRVLHRHQC